MKRRRSHWLIVLAALAIAASPAWLRDRVRGRLLSALAAVARQVASPAEAASITARAKGAPEPEGRVERELHRLRAENERLRKALQQAGAVPELIARQGAISLVPVDVAPLTAGTSIQRRLLLLQGRRIGLERGQAAIIGGALIGVIVNAQEDAAELRLSTDPAFRIRAVVKGTEVEGLVAGGAGDVLRFELVVDEKASDKADCLRVGALIVSSPRSSLCPIPSTLGRVTAVERFGSLVRATVRPTVDARGARSVIVLKRNLPIAGRTSR